MMMESDVFSNALKARKRGEPFFRCPAAQVMIQAEPSIRFQDAITFCDPFSTPRIIFRERAGVVIRVVLDSKIIRG
jgi:hypothetical protein